MRASSSSTRFLVLYLLVSAAYGQGEYPDALYKCSVDALKKKDCALAKTCWDKYKREFAEEFEKNPQAGKAIDDAVSKCVASAAPKQQEEITKKHVAGGASSGPAPSGGTGAAAAQAIVVVAAIAALLGLSSASTNH